MPLIHYVFSPDGNAFDNPEILPLDGLPHGQSALRASLDTDARKIWIMDESARKSIMEGPGWELLNMALLGIDQKHGLRFLDRGYGYPPGVNVPRLLSRYPAWTRLVKFMRDEFNSEPVDVTVIEHSDPNQPDIAFIPGQRPIIYANRDTFKSERGDCSFHVMSNTLFRYYLRNLGEIMKSFPEVWRSFGPRYKRWSGKSLTDVFFAVDGPEGLRVFKMPMDEGGAPTQQDEVEKATGSPYIMFSHDPDSRNIALLNCIPLETCPNEGDEGALVKKLVERIAKSSGLRPEEMFLTFDPALAKPFVSNLGSYVIVKDILDEAEWIGQDIRVVEAPIDVKEDAVVIPSPEEEDLRSPSSKRYRAINGINVQYPFLLVDSRIRSWGKKFRAILAALCRNHDPLSKLCEEDFCKLARGRLRDGLRSRMEYLMEMGLDKRSTLDLMAGHDMVRRAELREIMEDCKVATASRIADLSSVGLGINDWWHIGLQETLNSAEHKDSTPIPQPYNLRRARESTTTTEDMLRRKHDKEMSAYKTMEQLLRESQL